MSPHATSQHDAHTLTAADRAPYDTKTQQVIQRAGRAGAALRDALQVYARTTCWLSGDIVFANSTCFDIALMRALAAVAGGMRPGAWLITLTRRVESDDFELVDKRNYSMSWGTATCFVHRRRPEEESEKKK